MSLQIPMPARAHSRMKIAIGYRLSAIGYTIGCKEQKRHYLISRLFNHALDTIDMDVPS
jgi:hypothetical protein